MLYGVHKSTSSAREGLNLTAVTMASATAACRAYQRVCLIFRPGCDLAPVMGFQESLARLRDPGGGLNPPRTEYTNVRVQREGVTSSPRVQLAGEVNQSSKTTRSHAAQSVTRVEHSVKGLTGHSL